MVTCKYCGTNLQYVGLYKDIAYFYCDFCDLIFDVTEISENRRRKYRVPLIYDPNVFQPTKNLLKYNALELMFMLKECNLWWYSLKRALEHIYSDPTAKHDNEVKMIYEEYVTITKHKFVLENLILEKAGFLPDKITEDFLAEMQEYGKKYENRPMYIYIKPKTEKNVKMKGVS